MKEQKSVESTSDSVEKPTSTTSTSTTSTTSTKASPLCVFGYYDNEHGWVISFEESNPRSRFFTDHDFNLYLRGLKVAYRNFCMNRDRSKYV